MIKRFLLLWAIFSIGMFFGEWLLDIILKSDRDIIKSEARDAIIIGFIVALLIAANSFIRKRRNKQ